MEKTGIVHGCLLSLFQSILQGKIADGKAFVTLYVFGRVGAGGKRIPANDGYNRKSLTDFLAGNYNINNKTERRGFHFLWEKYTGRGYRLWNL